MQVGVLVVGLVMAVATLLAIDLVLPGGFVAGSGSLVEARTMGFTVLVLAQLFNVLNSRSDRDSASRGLFANWRLFAAIGLSLVLQVVVVHVPLFNDAFGTTPLGLDDWLVCALLASSVLVGGEAWKVLVRRTRSGPGQRATG
jgi:magnesium-transporting ATPase (P-type)